MDKSSGSGDTSSSSRDQYLKHLNKLSHKISKPTISKPSFDPHHHHHHQPESQPQTQAQSQPLNQTQTQSQPHNLQNQQHQHQHHQPPVYNISKSDFRDVVQKLTGSPARHPQQQLSSAPPPIQPPKPPSSRLQRIRPPPLAQISHRPPPLLNYASVPGAPLQPQALSPLPPFPTVHAAAESPISAYMRYIQSSMPPQPQPENVPPPPQFPTMPSSPLPFGCFPSPRSPYPLLSPNLLFSPTTAGQLGLGFQQFPVSPRFPMPSPGWKGL